jgi:soluble lytic murein transglycosylase-like protein
VIDWWYTLMVFLGILLTLGAALGSETAAAGRFETMAREGRWERILEIAARRSDQLPLRPDEALIAAHAAREMGDRTAEEHFLIRAMESPDLAAVARVELAGLVVDRDPDQALDLVLELMGRAPSSELKDAATEVAVTALATGVDSERRAAVERVLPTVHRSARRALELALATSVAPRDLDRLRRLLASSTGDPAALAAANELEASGELDAADRWRVAQTLYRHALYDRAALILQGLDGVEESTVSQREVAFLRGRCGFRRGRWDDAVAWYRKAISRTSSGERRAELEVHLGRAYELAGEMDEAVAAAQRAVRARVTDERRLFLARLRLARDEPDLAAAGLSRLGSRSDRARGEVMLALYDLRRGQVDAARRKLAAIRHRSWRGPAAVLAAGIAAAAGDTTEALALVVDSAPSLDSYWAGEARRVTGNLPPEALAAWRRQEAAALADPNPRTRTAALARSLKVEPESGRLGGLRDAAATDLGFADELETPVFAPGVASRLWQLGLPTQALRWDPKGLPRDCARATWWTAEQELALGRPWLAISAADAAWHQASSAIPERGLPASLRRALFPLPDEAAVRQAAERHRVPWSLLAGVAREESKWNPRVVSSVGARGVMQLMPATAEAIGAANGRPEVTPDDLFQPAVSLDLGAAELGRLLEVFDGNRAAAVAAYNAGEAQARLWLEQCGGVCPEERLVAQVSFSVTRAYTEDVLAAAAAYAELYVAVTRRSGSPPAARAPATPTPRSRR